MKIIHAPKVGTSDLTLKINNLISNNTKIEKGDVICEVETSKASYEVESDTSGFIYFFVEEGTSIEVGSQLAFISETLITDQEVNHFINNKNNQIKNIGITRKAKLLIEKHNIDINEFSLDLITENDVQNFIDSKKNNEILVEQYFNQDDILIIGIGGHAGMCIDIIRSINKWNIIGFLDDQIIIDERYGLKYLGKISNLNKLVDNGLKNAIIGIGFIGNLKKRHELYNNLKQIVQIPTIIHSSAIIEKSATIELGCQIMAGAIIGSNVFIGQNCIINSGAIVSHDSIISESSHMTPGATLAGHVIIGKRVTVGMCSTIYIGVSISDDKIITNGKTVIENV